jgi:hypothetical protein
VITDTARCAQDRRAVAGGACARALRVGILQSNYMPWKGYFDLINDCDAFVFYDDVQFTKNDWRNRNRIKTSAGPAWITIPVGADIRRRICDVRLTDQSWQKKHYKTLTQIYGKAPYFARYRDFLEQVYVATTWYTLSELNHFVICTIAHDFLGITTRFLRSSELTVPGRNQDRVLNLCKAAGATQYVSGPAAKAYLDETRFRAQGIEVRWKDYSGYPEYLQFHPPFEHAVTILDLLFHAGPDAPYYIWGWRRAGIS